MHADIWTGAAPTRYGAGTEEYMRRRFKLATVFTGVATVAGGVAAVGPMALAANAQTNAANPIPNQICGANNGGVSHWFHVFYPNDAHAAECFHGTGAHSERGIIHSFCGGEARGQIYGHLTTTGFYYTRTYGPGTTRAKFSNGYGSLSLSSLIISGWTGADKCLG